MRDSMLDMLLVDDLCYYSVLYCPQAHAWRWPVKYIALDGDGGRRMMDDGR